MEGRTSGLYSTGVELRSGNVFPLLSQSNRAAVMETAALLTAKISCDVPRIQAGLHSFLFGCLAFCFSFHSFYGQI